MRFYVGDLPSTATERDIRKAFAAFAKVASVRMKKFAAMDMLITEQAQAAIVRLNGTQFNGEVLRVSEARARSEKTCGHRIMTTADRPPTV